MTRTTVLRKAATLGVDVESYRDYAFGFTVDLHSPHGVRFAATACHALCLTGQTARETWAEIGADLTLGLEPCPADCWCRASSM